MPLAAQRHALSGEGRLSSSRAKPVIIRPHQRKIGIQSLAYAAVASWNTRGLWYLAPTQKLAINSHPGHRYDMS